MNWKRTRQNLAIFSASLTLVVTALLSIPLSSSALSGSSFQPGRIIDDFVFFNSGTMDASQIQTFLNSKLSSCDTHGAQNISYSYNYSTHKVNDSSNPGSSVTTSRALFTYRVYAQKYSNLLPPNSNYDSNPFKASRPSNISYNSSTEDPWFKTNANLVCLKDFNQGTIQSVAANSYCSAITGGNGLSSAEIIHRVAVACNINPRVLIVLLQKEQGLVTDDWPWSTQYRTATGYGCPDTAACDSTYYGFFNQVYNAAKQFQRYTKLPGDYNYVAGANNNIYYNPSTSCGFKSVFIQNQATAALYNYTPYQPNKAALNNLYGSGDSCSAYGNRNFWRDYNDWFGSTWVNAVRVSVTSTHTTESGGTITVKFSLIAQPSANVTIPLTLSDTTEGSLNGITGITITPATWNSPDSNTVVVHGADDSLHDGDVSYLLITHTPSSTDNSYGNLSGSDIANARLYNDDNESDISLPGDWNGDHKDTISLRRGYTNLINDSLDGRTDSSFDYGSSDYNDTANDAVLVGDWNGDGKDDVGFKVGNYYYLNYNHDGHTDFVFQYGQPTDTPIVGDWNGDGKDTIALKRGNNYMVNNGLDGRTDMSFMYGDGTETPLSGDWNGDHKDTISLRKGYSNLINNGLDGHTDMVFNYGQPTDTPIVGDWNGDGKDTIALKRGFNYLINNGLDGRTDSSFNYGR